MAAHSIVVFDLGGVLVDWNPRYLYRKLFGGDDAAMEHFLANICTSEWNLQQDAGRSFAEGCALLKSQHPNYAEFIDAWFGRHHEMAAGPISGTVEILAELRAREIPLYALTIGRRKPFLRLAGGSIFCSGSEGFCSPEKCA